MIKSMTCWQIECDECGTEFYTESDLGTILHYETEAEARARIVPCETECDASSLDLHQRGDRTLCTDCAHRADCAERGHQYREWQGPFPTGNGGRFRTCDHCRSFDVEPPEPAGQEGDRG